MLVEGGKREEIGNDKVNKERIGQFFGGLIIKRGEDIRANTYRPRIP